MSVLLVKANTICFGGIVTREISRLLEYRSHWKPLFLKKMSGQTPPLPSRPGTPTLQ
jgi:hypothetical protein